MSALAGPTRPYPPSLDQERQFAVWRVLALQRAPYLASLLYQVSPLNAPGLGTMGVDRWWRLYIDFDAVAEWGNDMCGQVLLHESMHLMGRHSEIGTSLSITPRLATVWNSATDCSINDDLRDMGCTLIAATGLLPGRFGMDDYRSATEYYAALLKRLPEDPGSGTPKDDQHEEGADKEQSGEGDSGGSQGEPSSPDTDSGSGGGDSGSDQGEDADDESTSPGPLCGGGSGTGGPAASWELGDADTSAPAVSTAWQEQVRQTVLVEARSHPRSLGIVPAGMLQELEVAQQAPSTPWEQVLMRFVARFLSRGTPGDQEVDYGRRSRRHHGLSVAIGGTRQRVFTPSRSNPQPRIAAVRDTSTSVSAAMLAVADREIMSVIARAGVADDELIVADVDAEVAHTRTVRKTRDIGAAHGRGGTEMIKGIEWAESLSPRPSAVIVLTDGFTPWPSSKGRVPVVACIMSESPEMNALRSAYYPVPDWIHVVSVDASALATKARG